jgi:hypothetical protein
LKTSKQLFSFARRLSVAQHTAALAISASEPTSHILPNEAAALTQLLTACHQEAVAELRPARIRMSAELRPVYSANAEITQLTPYLGFRRQDHRSCTARERQEVETRIWYF